MSHCRFRTARPAAVATLMAAVLLAATVAALFAPRNSHGQEGVLQDVPFGPTLFLLDAPDGAWPPALPPTAVLHAPLDEATTRFVASGAAGDLALLQNAGQVVQLLDADTVGNVYYLADAQADGAAEAAAQAGELLYAGAQVLIVATTPAQELALLDALGAQGVAVSLLSTKALAPPTDENMVAEAAGSAEAAPDPAVAAMLTKLTESDLRSFVDRISGQTAVTVGGTPVTLATRHTLSARVRDAERYVYEYYAGLGLDVAYASWAYGSYSGRNVVAEVRGSTNPEKVLLVGGHLDSQSQTPYTLAPGADDNATGTAATMLMARLLRDYRPAVTVRFIHFTGEEQGQWGSKVYAAALRQRGEQVIGLINLDMVGWDGNQDRVVEIHTGSGPKSNSIGTAFLERNTRYAQGLTFERKTTTASRFSDHSPFWDNDYASFLIIENFFDDATPRDRNPYYHDTGDLPLRVDFNYVARIGRVAMATLIELGGYNIGAGPQPTPTPLPPTPTPTPTATPAPNSCANLVTNGDFEVTAAWSFGSTPFPSGYVTSPVYSGARALRQGIPSASAAKPAHSSAYQRITLPANAPTPVTVRWMQRTGGAADGVDYREALLLDTSYRYIARLERNAAAGNDTWTARTYDLSAYRGRTLVLYFNVYNNGKGSQMWNYLDRVVVGSCTTSASAGEPLATPTPTPAPAAPTDAASHLFLPALEKQIEE